MAADDLLKAFLTGKHLGAPADTLAQQCRIVFFAHNHSARLEPPDLFLEKINVPMPGEVGQPEPVRASGNHLEAVPANGPCRSKNGNVFAFLHNIKVSKERSFIKAPCPEMLFTQGYQAPQRGPE